jgi:hypothetical protein
MIVNQIQNNTSLLLILKITAGLSVLSSLSGNASASTACTDGKDVYIISSTNNTITTPTHVGNATIGLEIWVSKNPDAAISAAQKFAFYLPKDKPGSLAHRYPNSLSNVTAAAVELADYMGKKVSLLDSEGNCLYDSGEYFDEILISN